MRRQDIETTSQGTRLAPQALHRGEQGCRRARASTRLRASLNHDASVHFNSLELSTQREFPGGPLDRLTSRHSAESLAHQTSALFSPAWIVLRPSLRKQCTGPPPPFPIELFPLPRALGQPILAGHPEVDKHDAVLTLEASSAATDPSPTRSL